MRITEVELRRILVDSGIILEKKFKEAISQAKKGNRPLEQVLVKEGIITSSNLGKAIAVAYDYEFADLKNVVLTDDLLELIPEAVARNQHVIAFEREKGKLRLATSNPENYEFIKFMEKKTGDQIEVCYATSADIEGMMKFYRISLREQVDRLIEDIEKNPELEGNVVKLVNIFLEYAYDNRASDIHIEPIEDYIGVRFRIDGVLHEVATYPKNLHHKVVFRIKIMSRLRTDEHAAAQDGRFDYKKNDISFDIRVSVVPVSDGENVVLRILSGHARRLSLEDLGLMGEDLKKIKQAIEKPYGMLLSVGPTGSGKTTTIYALLQILNKPEINIMTIEDPIEYDVMHVQQMRINPKKNLTFATGLRSIVRQDPDIIMIGEIRDNETAEIAINAAMTGHLILSTMHANDVATTFPRLIDMKIEPFLIASSVNIVIAQRLVRRICTTCKISYSLNQRELTAHFDSASLATIMNVYNKSSLSSIRVYKGVGCSACNHSGYVGRIGIFETMEMTDELRHLVIQKASSDLINIKAKELGMISMLHSGIVKVFEGITTLEEVVRVTKI